jgi:hypothetical protein
MLASNCRRSCNYLQSFENSFAAADSVVKVFLFGLQAMSAFAPLCGG